MSEFTIEAQSIPAPDRHEFILKSFANLNPEETLLIVNNHDPRPLVEQMKSVFGKLLEYNYVESGPNVWKVRFVRKKSEGCCGFCN